ncbi:hypothetical protein FKM82_018428, partial [Ascaphus truei]
VPAEREFIFSCLRFLTHLCRDSEELVLELLVTSIQTHPSHRAPLLVLFRELGLQDHHGFLNRQLNSWEQTESSRKILKLTCKEWLGHWTLQLRDTPRESSLPDLSPIEVLNYFCEVQLERKIREETAREAKTVLSLPPIHR